MRPSKLVVANGTGGYQVFKNPAVSRTPSQEIVLAFEGHTQAEQDQGLTAVLVCRSKDFGATWSEPSVVRKLDGTFNSSASCPSFVVDNVTGRVFLLTSFAFGDQETPGASDFGDTLHIQLAFSDDSGLTWNFRDITTQIDGPRKWRSRTVVPGHGIQLANGPWTGRLMQPIVIEDEDGVQRFVAVCSDDQGVSWWAGNPVGEGAIDCTVAEVSDGRVVMKSRYMDTGQCIGIYSEDGGRNWRGEEACFDVTPPGATAVIESAFPWAPAGTKQAQVILHPQVVYDDDGNIPFSALFSSADDLASFSGMSRIDTKQMRNPDVASVPECRMALVAYWTDRGIEVAQVPYDELGLHDLAYGWNKEGTEQDRILKELGMA